MSPTNLIEGFASAASTRTYTQNQGARCAPGHYSDFQRSGILLSSIGVGTYPGEASDAVDAAISGIVARALSNGLNVIDTGTHYRYGRSLRAVGAGLRTALAAGVARSAVFVASKGGFMLFPHGPPADPGDWFRREIVERGLGTYADLARTVHLLSPEYIKYQIDINREWLGIETLDAFLVDQPEVHIAQIGKPALIAKLETVFLALEQAVQQGKIRHYGVSTFHAFRAHTDDPAFLSLTSLIGLAEKAASLVFGGNNAGHHFNVIQMPFNQVMPEGFVRFNQVTGQGNETSTLQAAMQLKVYVMASHTLFKGHLAGQSIDVVQRALPELPSPAARAIQFNRSTPGLGTTLVGLSQPAHLEDALAVARIAPMERKNYLGMYEKAP